MVSQELLEILRCPVCVHNEPEGGDLEKRGNWLICGDCGRKYPIRDDIPVMLIDEGDRFRDTPAGELPETPPAELVHPAGEAPAESAGQEDWLPLVLIAAAGLLFGLVVVRALVKRCCRKRD